MKPSKSKLTQQPSQTAYFTALTQYKWICVSSFAVIMTVASLFAYRLAPPSGYTAQGKFGANTPPVKFSTIGSAILKQGEKLTRDDLLADNVLKAVADAVKIQPEQVRQNATLQLSAPEQPLEVSVQYRADDRQFALTTTDLLMKAMMEKSRLMNQDRWKAIQESINQRLQQVDRELQQSEQSLTQFSGSDAEFSRLEQQVKLQREIYEKTQSALADAKAAEKEVISSLTVVQLPQIIAYPGSNPIVPLTLATGVGVGLLVGLGIIPAIALGRQKAKLAQQERDRLQTLLYRLLKEEGGSIGLTRFAVEAQLSPDVAQRYLNRQAEAFNATCEVNREGGITYNFHLMPGLRENSDRHSR